MLRYELFRVIRLKCFLKLLLNSKTMRAIWNSLWVSRLLDYTDQCYNRADEILWPQNRGVKVLQSCAFQSRNERRLSYDICVSQSHHVERLMSNTVATKKGFYKTENMYLEYTEHSNVLITVTKTVVLSCGSSMGICAWGAGSIQT